LDKNDHIDPLSSLLRRNYLAAPCFSWASLSQSPDMSGLSGPSAALPRMVETGFPPAWAALSGELWW